MENNGKTHTNGKTNGHGPGLGEIDLSNNPFVSTINARDAGQTEPSKGPQTAPINEAKLPPVATEQKRNPRRKTLIFCMTVLAFACICLGLYAIYGGRRTIDYQIADKRKIGQPGQRVQSGTGMEEGATNQLTAEAIKQAKEELRRLGSAPEPGVAASPTPAASPESSQRTPSGATPAFAPYIVPDLPVSPSASRETGTSNGRGGEQPGNDANGIRAQPGTRSAWQTNRGSSSPAAYSIYAVAPSSAPKTSTLNVPAPSRAPRMESRGLISSAGVTVPSFGTMLPVRTLGAIFTLRQASLARFELTRDVSGDGWTLKRGTVLVAQQQGNEYDRAFLSLLGFINPETNRLVRLSGDLLGGDAAPGLKGKRRRISSRWTGVLNRVANGAVALGQAALSRGGSTAVIVPGSGIGSELGLSQNTLTRREFVEVPAGAPAYVLVTDLPKETKAIDADPATADDGDTLTDEELANLLSNGTTEEIRAALPRMQPEMRKVARLLLGEKDQ